MKREPIEQRQPQPVGDDRREDRPAVVIDRAEQHVGRPRQQKLDRRLADVVERVHDGADEDALEPEVVADADA